MIVSTVAMALNTGIHAGSGALPGMPVQLPNKIKVQKVNSASCRLCSGLFISFGTK